MKNYKKGIAKKRVKVVLGSSTEKRPVYNWQGFLSGEFAVTFNSNTEMYDFLFYCQKRGLRWRSGDKPLEANYFDEKKCRNIVHNYKGPDDGLSINADYIRNIKWNSVTLDFESPKEIKVGDMVKIINPKKCYAAYTGWLKDNAREYYLYFCYDIFPDDIYSREELKTTFFKVVAKAPHSRKETMLYLVQDIQGRCFIMDEEAIL